MNSALLKENTRRILVVGPFEESSQVSALRVAFRKCDVRVATDGATAAQVAQAFDPDLILLDMVHTAFDGAVVARTLKNSSRARIIGIAASVEPNRHTASHADCDVLIAKPVFAAVIAALSREMGANEGNELSP